MNISIADALFINVECDTELVEHFKKEIEKAKESIEPYFISCDAEVFDQLYDDYQPRKRWESEHAKLRKIVHILAEQQGLYSRRVSRLVDYQWPDECGCPSPQTSTWDLCSFHEYCQENMFDGHMDSDDERDAVRYEYGKFAFTGVEVSTQPLKRTRKERRQKNNRKARDRFEMSKYEPRPSSWDYLKAKLPKLETSVFNDVDVFVDQ